MLYIFYGTDQEEARDKASALLSGLQKKAPNAELIRITQDEVNNGNQVFNIDNLLGTQGLFKLFRVCGDPGKSGL